MPGRLAKARAISAASGFGTGRLRQGVKCTGRRAEDISLRSPVLAAYDHARIVSLPLGRMSLFAPTGPPKQRSQYAAGDPRQQPELALQLLAKRSHPSGNFRRRASQPALHGPQTGGIGVMQHARLAMDPCPDARVRMVFVPFPPGQERAADAEQALSLIHISGWRHVVSGPG